MNTLRKQEEETQWGNHLLGYQSHLLELPRKEIQISIHPVFCLLVAI